MAMKGYTVLHCAAAGGRHRIVDRLLDRALGVDAAAALPNGEDAAIMAGANGFKDLASKITRRVYVDLRRGRLAAVAPPGVPAGGP